ncbi:hypothetical protein C8Q75DRAFT_152319 [Abortiporus biennis]|nr:hypothetical protein C8Q75DRAFT_152319 [Abortiporus biennis]
MGRKKGGRKVVFKVDNGKRKIFRYVHPPSSSNSLASREESRDDDEADESQSQSQKRKRENEHSVAPSTDGEWYRAYFEDVPGDDIGSESESEDDDDVGGSQSNQRSSSPPNNQNQTTNSNSNSSPFTPPKPQLKKKEGDWWWSGWEEEEVENRDDEDMSADEVEVEYVDRGRQPGAKQKGRKRVVPRLKKSVASLNVRSILGMDEDDGRGDVDLDLEYL